LEEENGVEGETSDEAVENERVVDFLKRGEDADQRTGEVVENL